MLILTGNREQVAKALQPFMDSIQAELSSRLTELKSVTDLTNTVRALREEKSSLEVDAARRQEEYDRKEREIEHKIGLERSRQTQELELAKRESKVTVKEENLVADKKRFEEQMKFNTDRFTEETKYLKDMMTEVLNRLPNISASLKFKGE